MRKFMHERNCIDAIFSRLSSCCHSHTTTTTRQIVQFMLKRKSEHCTIFKSHRALFAQLKQFYSLSFPTNWVAVTCLRSVATSAERLKCKKALQLMGASREKGKENEFFEPLIGEKNNELKYERLFLIRCWIPVLFMNGIFIVFFCWLRHRFAFYLELFREDMRTRMRISNTLRLNNYIIQLSTSSQEFTTRLSI